MTYPQPVSQSRWRYSATIIEEVHYPVYGFQVLVDFPHGDGPVRVGPLHSGLTEAARWVDETERSFNNLPPACRDCGEDIQGEPVDDEGYSYCRDCALESGVWSGVCDDRR